MTETTLNPHHTSGETSNLASLVSQALTLWGMSAPGAVDGSTINSFLIFANWVVEEVNSHPYWENNDQVDYYTSSTQTTAIPDAIMVNGILFQYASQQESSRAAAYGQNFFRTMNKILWNRLNGNTPIEVKPLDRSSNRSTVNGRPLT